MRCDSLISPASDMARLSRKSDLHSVLMAAAILVVIGLSGCDRLPLSLPRTGGQSTIPNPTAEEIGRLRKGLAPLDQPVASRRVLRLPVTEEWTVKATAADALARIGEGAVGPLVDALANRDEQVRAQAARALARMGPTAEPAVDELIIALRDSNEEVRRNAARALGQIGPAAKTAIPALIEALGERAPSDQAPY